MASDDYLLELWNWLSLNSPFGTVMNLMFVCSLGGNVLLGKKVLADIKTEKFYIGLLKDVEPLLTKIIDGKRFTDSEIEEAKQIKNIIKRGLNKNVR